MATTALARADPLRKRLLLMLVALPSGPCVSLSIAIPLHLSSVRQGKKSALLYPELSLRNSGNNRLPLRVAHPSNGTSSSRTPPHCLRERGVVPVRWARQARGCNTCLRC